MIMVRTMNILMSTFTANSYHKLSTMERLILCVIFSIIFGVVSGALLNDGVREVHFKKLLNGSTEYEFEYELDNGETFRGQTYAVQGSIYFLFSAENEIYWTSIRSNEYEENENFTKIVREAKRDGDSIEFEDDRLRYSMTINGHFTRRPYSTRWNLSNICFTKADNQTFNFTIAALNNSRKYTGTTYGVTDDPKVQRVDLIDPSSPDGGVYEINFTDVEFLSDEEFCRKPDEVITFHGAVLSIVQGMWVNPTLLKTLVG